VSDQALDLPFGWEFRPCVHAAVPHHHHRGGQYSVGTGPEADSFCWDDDFYACPSRAATPPLVAASPVPPVVPDSEALDRGEFCPRCQGETETGTFGYSCACQGHCGKVGCSGALRSGSGVVPDKPALAPATDEALAAGREWAGDIASTFGWSVPAVTTADSPALASCGNENYVHQAHNWSPVGVLHCPGVGVPAVTDDEAATIHEVVANGLHAEACAYDHPRSECKWFYESAAREVIAALRSAGFLIVHHTKET
jgi:hypothetical protein